MKSVFPPIGTILLLMQGVSVNCGVAADWVGSASCASSTCHGGTVDRGPAWNHSYSVSRSADPHATAGALLKDEDSRRIILALEPNATSPAAYDLVLRKRCISCHLTATAEDIASTERLSAAKIAEGVSCESCHGPAGKWLTTHVMASWSDPERYQPETGMSDTESILGRAEVCVRCHVGSRTSDGIVRDMNHDLIAAGHPALRFDLLIYNENMPSHWDLQNESEQKFNVSASRVRNVGRSIGLAAAARLSSERAAASQSASSDSQLVVPWPELSDFDCFACHQALLPRSYRLPPNKEGKPPLSVSDGLPLWNAWFTALEMRRENKSVRAFKPKSGQTADWIKAADEIASLYSEKAKQASTAELTKDNEAVLEISKGLSKLAPADWNAAAAIYLDIDAALRDLAKQPVWKSYALKTIKTLQEKSLNLLLFKPSTDADEAVQYRGPTDFDPMIFRKNTLELP